MTFLEEMKDCSSAEDFLEFFDVEYDKEKVHPVRVFLLRRFKRYLKQITECHGEEDNEETFKRYRDALARSYNELTQPKEKRLEMLAHSMKSSCACPSSCSDISESDELMENPLEDYFRDKETETEQ